MRRCLVSVAVASAFLGTASLIGSQPPAGAAQYQVELLVRQGDPLGDRRKPGRSGFFLEYMRKEP